ncbi:4-(cytidine 5'-diphospho)-2-C-methyl-D-erythritol kinase, partial [Neisseria weixii]|uniref:4-(cytidine 5'-diphospho)-2-C-methyl-D-erythritol kinase n=1 Tax=Neisseria weixii TaxID=1853276 RepID=UPI0035A11D33
ACRAAAALKQAAGLSVGVDIWLHKNIPMGGGLGGGSSDAATVLMVLNRLWGCHFNREQLMEIGLKLGADVPFFIFGRSAFAQGVGEKLHDMEIPEQWYVVVKPDAHVNTAAIFSHQDLTRDSKPSIMPTFLSLQPFRNDMQAVVLKEFPQVAQAVNVLSQYGQARMTGSGACVFLSLSEKSQAKAICHRMAEIYQSYCVAGLSQHPLLNI